MGSVCSVNPHYPGSIDAIISCSAISVHPVEGSSAGNVALLAVAQEPSSPCNPRALPPSGSAPGSAKRRFRSIEISRMAKSNYLRPAGCMEGISEAEAGPDTEMAGQAGHDHDRSHRAQTEGLCDDAAGPFAPPERPAVHSHSTPEGRARTGPGFPALPTGGLYASIAISPSPPGHLQEKDSRNVVSTTGGVAL